MTTTCKLPYLPKTAPADTEICDKYGNRWQFDQDGDAWISKGALVAPISVTEERDGAVTPDIFDKLSRLRKFEQTRGNVAPLKLLPGADAYWYYFRSSDKFFRFKPEGEDVLRIEIDKGRLYQVLMKNACPGPKGDQGDQGDAGNNGIAGPDEICFQPAVSANKLDFAIHTPTPLLGDRSDISLPNGNVPKISVRIFQILVLAESALIKSTMPAKSAKKSKASKTGLYDQLQYLASYYRPFPYIATEFQKTRDLLVRQSLGATKSDICSIPLSDVYVFPLGAEVATSPLITIEIDPLGVDAPTVVTDGSINIDVDRTIQSISFDQTTNLVCGSIYSTSRPWQEPLCVKSRQKGPDGARGVSASPIIRVSSCELDNSNIIATCPIINVRMGCDQNTLYTICADLTESICVESVKFTGSAGTLSDKTALEAVFASAQMILDDCKIIHRYQPVLKTDEIDGPQLYHWDPQPGCVTKRHYNRHNFNWVPETNIPACNDLATWYDPDLLAKSGKYPHEFRIDPSPKKDECCQEDWFYCPNIQEGCKPSAGSTVPPPPPINFRVVASSTAPVLTSNFPCDRDKEKLWTVILSVEVVGGIAPFDFVWSGLESNHSTEESPRFCFAREGAKTIKVVATDSRGNKASDTVTVQIKPLPQ